MSQTVARCEAAMPLDLLSAWHDHEVPPDVEQRVRQHVATCQACQAHLTAYEADGRAIRDFAPPLLQDAIWRNVQPATTQPSSRRSAPPRGVILGGLGAALAVVLLFATISIIYLNNHGHSLTVVPTGTPKVTNTVVPTATVATLKVSPSQGWVSVPALSFGKAVAFSQSDPLTGYVCGNNASTDVPQPIQLSITHDGGLTWSAPVLAPVNATNCQVFINPTNVGDIVLEGNDNWGPGDGSRSEYGVHYRSLDGGKTWTKLVFPAGDPYPDNLWMFHFVWIGSTLFVSTGYNFQNPPGPTTHQVAKSVNDGSLEWTDQTLPLHNFIDSMYAVGSTLYIAVLGGCSSSLADYCRIIQSGDEGTTWSQTTPQGLAKLTYQPPIGSTDDKTVLMVDGKNHLLSSSDGGHSWTQIASYADAAAYCVIQAMLPDGTLYLTVQSNGNGASQPSLYKLTKGAISWVLVAADTNLTTISWDTSGHATALWRVHLTGDEQPGIEYHAA